MKRPEILAAALIAGTLTVTTPLPSLAFTPEETSEIETIIRDYLLREPEVLVEALNALEEKRTAQAESNVREAIASAGPELAASPEGTVLGNPEGDVTIVEFFDYNCGYCRRAHADMEALIDDDPELRFVLKEIPVLGPQSEEASRVSLAVRHLAPERYEEFHGALLASETTADEVEAVRVAVELGLDEASLREALDAPEVASALQESARLAALLNITGTPSYIVGGELVPGAIGAAPLAERVANVRECGAATC